MNAERFKELWAQAEKAVLEIVADDAKWNLFVQQLKGQDLGISGHQNARQMAKNSECHRAFLQSSYIHVSLIQICDSCDYNPNHRRGQRKFTKRERFDCDWEKTEGDVFAEQTGREQGVLFAVYKFNDPQWKARYEELSKKVLETHQDRTKAPSWLDSEKNLCPHFYVDLSRA